MKKLEGFSLVNMTDMGTLNRTLGGLAGQGVNYALTGDFALNLFNVQSTGVLELHLGKQGFGMNLGMGGLDASLGTIAGAFRGAAVWGTNALINSYVENNLDIPVALRSQYGFGDKTQKDQLWDILADRTEIIFKEGDYEGLSETEDGKKIIYLGQYKEDMTVSEQMRLGAILGHEAYRDGMGTGEFDELRTSSIARILMSDRINDDYNWFYKDHDDLGFESFLLSQTGGNEVFDDYIKEFYKNDKDYLWKWIKSDEDHQDDDKYKDIPLLGDLSRKTVDEINEQRLEVAMEKYKEILANKDTHKGNASLFIEGKTDAEIKEYIKSDKALQAELKYAKRPFYSLRNYGCMLFSAIYGAETISGRDLDPAWVNQYVKEKGLYRNGSELSRELIAEIMTKLSGGEFIVEHYTSRNRGNLFSLLELLSMEGSETMYISHLRVATGGLTHSEMVAGLEYDVVAGQRVGLKYINTANPWKGGDGKTKLSMTKITPDMIERWDVYKVTPTYFYDNRIYRESGKL
jgi:hypothetical protein